VDMYSPCAVSITPTSFLAIDSTDIREFDAAIAGPTSSEGWREAGHWPRLKKIRDFRRGCSKIDQKVIIAGGRDNIATLSSTEVLNLIDRRISVKGEMARLRRWFHLATIISGGEEKVFALSDLNKVEEWVEAESTWKAANNVVEKREGFGSVAVPRNLICPLEDSLLLITGGEGGAEGGNSFLSSTEVYPSTSGCSPPPLPLGRTDPTTFVTSETSALVATCGGHTDIGPMSPGDTASCLVLDPINQFWDESRMGNLAGARVNGAAATLNNIGVFIVGGYLPNNRGSSEFLATGTMQWQEGPALPVDMYSPCAVSITPTSFLAIDSTDIREFDAAIAGPTSSEGWREAGHWPRLKKIRDFRRGCSKIDQKVIIAGGRDNIATLSSTEVLNLIDRRISVKGEMASPRRWFHLATIISGGEEKMFALAGTYGSYDGNFLNKVEEWVETNSTWKAADSLVEGRRSFGAVAVPKHLICPLNIIG